MKIFIEKIYAVYFDLVFPLPTLPKPSPLSNHPTSRFFSLLKERKTKKTPQNHKRENQNKFTKDLQSKNKVK